MQLKFTNCLDVSLYFFRKSKQKASSLSNRFAYKVVRDDISLINRRFVEPSFCRK